MYALSTCVHVLCQVAEHPSLPLSSDSESDVEMMTAGVFGESCALHPDCSPHFPDMPAMPDYVPASLPAPFVTREPLEVRALSQSTKTRPLSQRYASSRAM